MTVASSPHALQAMDPKDERDDFTAAPIFSVIVIGYRRPLLIRDAIESIVEQTIRRSAFELVVITDYEDDWIDRNCSMLGGVHTVMEGTVGAFLAAAIRQARGAILCFLDDDDMFHPDKLKFLEREILSSPEIGYYHNSWTNFSEKAQALQSARLMDFSVVHRRKVTASLRGYGELTVSQTSGWTSGFNLSCVSMRRTVVEPYLATLTRIRAATDSVFLALGLLSNLDAVFSDATLTFYRIHVSYSRPEASNLQSYRKEICDHSYLYLDSLEKVRQLAVGGPLELVIACDQTWWRIRAALFGSERRLPPKLLLQILRSPLPAQRRLFTTAMYVVHQLGLGSAYCWISLARSRPLRKLAEPPA